MGKEIDMRADRQSISADIRVPFGRRRSMFFIARNVAYTPDK